MKVTRITIDQELGIISITTGPGGDGDYVLLPLDLPPIAAKYVRYPDETFAEAPEPFYSGMGESPAEARGDERRAWNEGYDAAVEEMGGTDYGIRANPYNEAVVLSGGWSVPKDQMPGHPFGLRGGVQYERSPELQKSYEQAIGERSNPNLVDDTVAPVITPEPDPHARDFFAITDVNGYVVTSIANDRADYTYHPGEGRWLPNPLPVYADEHGRGYRLYSPHIPHWSYDIQKYELHRTPTLALAAAKRAGKDITNTDVAVIIKEMS